MKNSVFKRLLSAVLAALMTATVTVVFPATALAAEGGFSSHDDPNATNIGIEYMSGDINVSYLKRLETADGAALPVGSSTNAIHGGHHTRVLRTEYGTYAVIITGTEIRDGQVMEAGPDGNWVAIDLEEKYGGEYPYWYQGINTYSVVRITPDGVEVIFEDVCPENMSSHVPEIYAGDDGRFFVCLPAEDPETYAKNLVDFNYGLIPESQFKNAAYLKVQEFDAATGELIRNSSTVIPFDTTAMQDHGYGKPSACVDTAARKIYFSFNGAAGPAYFAMFIYDMDTGEFDPNPHTLTIDYRRDYYNMYPDGQGGIFFIIERTNTKSDAAALLGIEFNNNNGFAWDGCYFYHVYDVAAVTYSNDTELDRELYGYKEVAVDVAQYEEPPYKNAADSVSHYGKDGCTYLDDQNRLHVIYTHSVGNTRITTVRHAVLDPDGNILSDTMIPTSLLKNNGTKTFKGSNGYTMTQDADGKYYVLRFTNASKATLDIWTSEADDGITFKRVVTEHPLVTENGETISIGYPIIGNSRDGSVRDGVIPILFNSSDNPAPDCPQAYYYFAVQIGDRTVCEHDYEAAVTEATCTEQGYTTYTCTICGDSYVGDHVDALGHEWGEGAVTTPATDKEDGVMTYTCSRCGETRTEIIPKTGEEPIDTTKIFKDVKADRWYTDAINYVYTHGLMNGMTEDTFEPDTTMSRAMVVTVLFRMDGGNAVDSTAPFTDLKAKWYRDAVNWAYESGVVNGVSETLFDPDGNVTREQLAAILYRYTEYKNGDVSGIADISAFPDASRVSGYARDAVLWAVAEGLISGTRVNGRDYLDPRGNATRAQVATILMRYLTK